MSSHWTLNLLALWFWNSQPSKLWAINFYCLQITQFKEFCLSIRKEWRQTGNESLRWECTSCAHRTARWPVSKGSNQMRPEEKAKGNQITYSTWRAELFKTLNCIWITHGSWQFWLMKSGVRMEIPHSNKFIGDAIDAGA